MRLHIAKNKKLGNKKAFEIIKEQILKKPDSLIALAAGKTTDGLHKLISRDSMKSPTRWEKVKVLQIDENLEASPYSSLSFNFELRKELKQLFKILNPKNIFFINGMKPPKQTIKEMYKFIKQNKGINLITLGIGPDYDPHIAYNTSGKSSLKSKIRVVALHSKTIKKIQCRGVACNAPTKGITLGVKDILDAKKILLIAYGKEKAKSIKLAFGDKKVNMKKASASALLLHESLIVVVDKEAGISLL